MIKMHWSEIIADRIIKRNPDKEEYVCAAGISPSGSIHIGNFRDIATSYFVVRALIKKGKKAKPSDQFLNRLMFVCLKDRTKFIEPELNDLFFRTCTTLLSFM